MCKTFDLYPNDSPTCRTYRYRTFTVHLFDNIFEGDIKGFVFQHNSRFTNLLVQLSIFLFNLYVGTYRLSSHARLEAFVIQTKHNIHTPVALLIESPHGLLHRLRFFSPLCAPLDGPCTEKYALQKSFRASTTTGTQRSFLLDQAISSLL